MAIVYGIHAVTAAIDQLEEILLESGRRPNVRLAELIDQAKKSRVNITYVHREELDRLAENERHQGVVARLAKSGPAVGNDPISFVEGLDHPPFVLILDGVTDPHNLGEWSYRSL